MPESLFSRIFRLAPVPTIDAALWMREAGVQRGDCIELNGQRYRIEGISEMRIDDVAVPIIAARYEVRMPEGEDRPARVTLPGEGDGPDTVRDVKSEMIQAIADSVDRDLMAIYRRSFLDREVVSSWSADDRTFDFQAPTDEDLPFTADPAPRRVGWWPEGPIVWKASGRILYERPDGSMVEAREVVARDRKGGGILGSG